MDEPVEQTISSGLEIAIIGVAGRFPGAKNIDEFWENLKNGVESITFYSDEELKTAGVKPDQLKDPNYVKTRGALLENKEYFDASFFGFSAREAEAMDPQVRIFHESVWGALEHAGYALNHNDKSIGLYAGASADFDWKVLCMLSGKSELIGSFALSLLTDKDYLCTRVSYNLDLNGPSVTVKTACSTSLVAIHMACQALLNGECDLALAGGISVSPKKMSGYLYQEGMIGSPDGHCRAFDEKSKGLFPGEGVGVVFLKLLEDAIADRDFIHAVIKGTALNNDGNRKVGFTAPSVIGQAEAISMAYKVADIEPESISYIETHGTGTEVGDPIEIEALKMAFHNDKKNFCRLGSVKTNIGHLDAAAGVAGVIKTTLALKHQLIPPSLHYENPNPKIDFENSPFYVNTTLTKWESNGKPRRAGVSSFGMGGTNAHVVLEEWPDRPSSNPGGRSYQLIPLSAKTESALNNMTENLAEYLKKNPGVNLADASYTLQVGRKTFPHRRMLVCATTAQAIAALTSPGSGKLHTYHGKPTDEDRAVIFMFPGLGSQYVDMGLELYQTETVFQEEMDRCFEILKPLMGHDSKEILYPEDSVSEVSIYESARPPGTWDSPLERGTPDPGKGGGVFNINQTEIVPIVIFIFEYALAQLLMKWGIKPNAMIGYSLGEYTAACLSGVISLQDALSLIVWRGQAVRELLPGAMLSVPLPRNQLLPLLKEYSPGISLAIDNGPSCIVAGPVDEIDTFEKHMKEKRYMCVRLHSNRAIHSTMMRPILKKFQEKVKTFDLKRPQIPYISNVTGQWITGEQALDPAYWAEHLEGTVRFADGIKQLLKTPHSIFLEIGPGYDLGVLLRHHVEEENKSNHLILNLVKHSKSEVSDTYNLLNKIGRLWSAGVKIDWSGFYAREERYRLPLPTYPFQRLRYWIDENPLIMGALRTQKSLTTKGTNIGDWFYIPSWKRSVLDAAKPAPPPGKRCWLVFMDESGLGSQLAKRLEQEGEEVVITRKGTGFTRVSDREYIINPQQIDDYHVLIGELCRTNNLPDRIVHLWLVAKEKKEPPEVQDTETCFYSLLYFAQAVGKQGIRDQMQIQVISNGLQKISGEEELCPEKATALGAVHVIPQEYTNIRCRSIDIVLPELENDEVNNRLIHQLLVEFSLDPSDTIVAYRGDYRWVQIFEPMRLDEPQGTLPLLKEQGIYLITGGLGGIGLVLAEHLAKKVHAKLILTGRSALPEKEEWDQWLKTHKEDDSICRKIKKVKRLEELGAEVFTCSADVSDLERMQQVIALAKERFGRIDGVIHSAGLPDGGVIPLRTRETIDPILLPKVKGTLVLDRVLKNLKYDFLIICSSISSIRGQFGQIAYCAANSFQDAFANYKSSRDGIYTLSINWDTWQEVGMGVEIVKQLIETENITDADELLANGILPSEGTAVFDRLLGCRYPQVVVSTRDLSSLLEWINMAESSAPEQGREFEEYTGTLHQRPELSTEYVPPKTRFEITFANILQKFFGYQQVGIHDNFFEFGITSLAMIQVNNLLRKETKKDIPIVAMFDYPTIYLLGEYLSQEEEGRRESELKDAEDFDKRENILHDSINIFKNTINYQEKTDDA
jgi:acyl transferase domain-containing protein